MKKVTNSSAICLNILLYKINNTYNTKYCIYLFREANIENKSESKAFSLKANSEVSIILFSLCWAWPAPAVVFPAYRQNNGTLWDPLETRDTCTQEDSLKGRGRWKLFLMFWKLNADPAGFPSFMETAVKTGWSLQLRWKSSKIWSNALKIWSNAANIFLF